MNRVALLLISLVTPAVDRESVLGDTVEEFERVERLRGRRAARRWLWSEVWRVMFSAPRHRLAVRSAGGPATSLRGDGPMASLWQDARYALRLLGRSPGFAAIAIATLALGIGANTAMFAVVNAVLFKPLPFRDPDRLMLVHLWMPDHREAPGTYRDVVWSYPKYQTFLRIQQAFEQGALFSGRDFNVAGDVEPERVRGEVVTNQYPGILGIEPIIGRTFTHAEAHTAGASPVALIGHALWTRRFGADRAVLGRTMDINGTPSTIVGVLPRGFRGLSGNAQLWVPLGVFEPVQMQQNNQYSHSYYLVARRKPEVPEPSAAEAVRLIGSQVESAHPSRAGGGWSARAVSLYASRVDADLRRASLVLLGAVAFVLLIACVNLTNLVWARAIARRREVGVRVAIGASRGRIVRQFLVEGSLLAGCGAVAGVLLAWALLNTATALLPESDIFFRTSIAPGMPRTSGAAGLTRIGAGMIGVDAVTLMFTTGIAALAAVLVSLLPALQASTLRPVDALKTGGKGIAARGLRASDPRTTLVTVQIALALVLMAGAGLMIRSAARLYRTDIGVTLDRLLTVRIDLPRASYTEATGATFLTQIVDRVRAIPGVDAVALGNCPPVSGGCNTTGIEFPGGPRAAPGAGPLVGIYWATPGYFSTLGIKLLQGRNFTDRDRTGQPKVALVNETAARVFWPNDTPIGKTIAVGQGGFHDGAEVVGVVSNVRYRSLETPAMPDVYIPLAQSYQSWMRLFVRSNLETAGLVSAIAREVRALDPNLPLSEIKSMNDRLGDAMWRTRVGAWLLSTFAALALLLTAIGVFGVMAQSVTQRTSEIGIRVALGAQRRDVLKLVFGRAALLTGIGLVVGIASALGLTRFMRTLLYDVPPNDPLTLASVTLVLGVVALAACYVPSRRAVGVDAVVALRTE